MTRDARFWRNVIIVGLIHVAILLGLIGWSRSPRRPPNKIFWMKGGAGAAAGACGGGAPARRQKLHRGHAGGDTGSDDRTADLK
jgi:hypothetical protein